MAMQRQGRGVADRSGAARQFPASILARMRHAGQPAARTQPRLGRARICLPPRQRSSISPPWSGPRRRRGAAASPSTRCCWRRGWVSQPDYAAALADRLGVPSSPGMPRSSSPMRRTGRQPRSGCRRGSTAGRATCWPRPQAPPDALLQQVAALRGQRRRRGLATAAPHRCGARGAAGSRSGSIRPCAACSRQQPASSARRSHLDLAGDRRRVSGRAPHRRLLRAAGRDPRRADHVDRPAVPVRDAAAARRSAPGDGGAPQRRCERAASGSAPARPASCRSTRCWCRCSARPRCCPA